ncbi:hypothetical protein F2Q69_00004080 [Brassica cretica]|uniref:Uncharacterized protein n=1 Tax=Brassica cretica TaxID=69181 RepID=A0A8S9NYA7_BRACR|nr:hypothetical protein F2Q69_00004080 [Brassica cretica]
MLRKKPHPSTCVRLRQRARDTRPSEKPSSSSGSSKETRRVIVDEPFNRTAYPKARAEKSRLQHY